MLNSANIRIENAVSLLHKSKGYIEQSRRNIEDYRNNRGNTIPLENALTNNRIALEGYYKALMALYGLTEDDIYLLTDIQNCLIRTETDDCPCYSLKNYKNSERKAETDLIAKENVFINFVGISAQNASIANKARSYGNSGSHFNFEKVYVDEVEGICNATSGLVDDELIYLTNENLNKNDVDQEIVRLYSKIRDKLITLQEGSFQQCEENYKDLKGARRNNCNVQEIDKKQFYLDRSLQDNLQLTELRSKYTEVCYELEVADTEKKLKVYRDIYQYISPQSRGTEISLKINSRIGELKHELMVRQSKDESNENYGLKSAKAIAIALLVFFVIIAILGVMF